MSDLQKMGGQAGWMVEKAQRGRSGGRNRVGQYEEEKASRGHLCLALSSFARLLPSNLGVRMAALTGKSPYTPVINYL